MNYKEFFPVSTGGVIIKDDKILCLEHLKCKSKFTHSVGHVETGEEPYEAMVRELKEELGVNVKMYERLFDTMAVYDRVDGIKIYNEHVFLVHDYTGEITNMEPEKHPTMKWFDIDYIVDNPNEFLPCTYIVANMIKVKKNKK